MGQEIGGGVGVKTLKQKLNEILTDDDLTLDEQREALLEAVMWYLPEHEKSHTLASENAEMYKAFDEGQTWYKQLTIIYLDGER